MGQLSFMDDFYTKYKITKPIALIELFAGYGSQALSLEHLGVEHISHRICEWNAYSSIAYQHLHSTDYTDYSKDLTKDEIVKFLYDKGVSLNWNAPATIKQLNNKKDEFLRETYNSIIATNNLVDVTKVHANDLAIRERERWCVVMTYSFPCQDLSLAGKRGGMNRESGTRSSLLWEVERILLEMKEINQLPDVLLLENVKELIGEKNIHNFNEWVGFLLSLGYETYTDVLNASDYGIPQHRERVFALSLRGEDIYYTFPEAQPLTKCLGDLLESNVDHKYFITKEKLEAMQKWNAQEKPLENIERERVVGTITTHAGKDSASIKLVKETLCDQMIANNQVKEGDVIQHSYSSSRMKNPTPANSNEPNCSPTITTRADCLGVTVVGNYSPSNHNASRVVASDGLAPTVMENHGTITGVAIKNATKQGYLMAEQGDGIDISGRMEYHRGTVQKGKSQTISTMGGNNVGVISGLAIRKLTPRECFRLMGLYDTDIDKIIDLFSDAILYHLAGDSIVVQVLEGIIGQMI